MLSVDRKNPAFDETMEVLCLLPKKPVGAPLNLIAEDLGIENQKRIRTAIERLVSMKIRVETWRGREGYEAAIHPDDWSRAKGAGEDYLRSVSCAA